jgi:alpha-D-ribose 1-methylphosphonate 5-triphosphate diphosphatase PhnM
MYQTESMQNILKNFAEGQLSSSHIETSHEVGYDAVSQASHQIVYEGQLTHISIIDYLQKWNAKKKSERYVKIILGKSAAGLSAIEPQAYCKRFIEFMEEYVF